MSERLTIKELIAQQIEKQGRRANADGFPFIMLDK